MLIAFDILVSSRCSFEFSFVGNWLRIFCIHDETTHPHELSLLSDTHHPCVAAVWRGYRTFAMNLISISCVGSASRGVTRIVLATSGLFAPYASFRTRPATANAISMSVT